MTFEEKILLVRFCEDMGMQLETDNSSQYILYTDLFQVTCPVCSQEHFADVPITHDFCSSECAQKQYDADMESLKEEE